MDNNQLQNLLIKFRRDLHKIPELDRNLPKTINYLKDYLENLPCVIIDIGDAGFAAFFQAPGAATTLAFRTDMDALPIKEATGLPFSSEHENQMHACGHDGHMSIMLGFATIVADCIQELANNVLLIFQTAEETTGGAKDIARSGIFEKGRVEKIYGLHLWPGFPKDTIVSREREFMASTCVFSADIAGKSTHVGTLSAGVDALELGCEFVRSIYEMERTEISPDTHRLLRIGIFESGTATNIVSGFTHLEGTLRCYSDNVQNRMWGRIEEIAEDIMSKRKCVFTFDKQVSYPPVINPKVLYRETRKKLVNDGFVFQDLELPLLVSEDFSFYQKIVPGVFLHLGTGIETPLHSCDYTIDEDVLITGVNVFKSLLVFNDNSVKL